VLKYYFIILAFAIAIMNSSNADEVRYEKFCQSVIDEIFLAAVKINNPDADFEGIVNHIEKIVLMLVGATPTMMKTFNSAQLREISDEYRVIVSVCEEQYYKKYNKFN
jgi:hypothetical protein